MKNRTYLDAALKKETDTIPVWYMRQAGRSQPEYRKLKEKYSLEDIVHQPELCADVTALPVEDYGVDAAILFKDITTPFPGIGVPAYIKDGVGPIIDEPIRSMQDVLNLRPFEPEESTPFVYETIRMLSQQRLEVPLIGFVGGPFTLASYMIEGRPSKNYAKTKSLMISQPDVWHLLMDHLAEMIIKDAHAQVLAGASALQIFDSWVGNLNVQQYQLFIKPVMQKIFSSLKACQVPITLFAFGGSHLISEFKQFEINVIGLDWRLSFSEARAQGVKQTLQGNLDPAFLTCDWSELKQETTRILTEGKENGSFIFNLGHGVFPEVEPSTLRRLTDFVHDFSKN